MRKTSRLLAATLALSLAHLVAPGAAHAADFDTCLVLSGGGARGMAHIGVIKVLERERIPVDCIVGTSMGAVVGSLYASGLSATEIETQMRALDWNTMFVDRIDRSVFTARRKAEDRSFLAKGGFGLRDGKVGVPPSLFEGQRLAVALRAALLPSATIDRFDDLPIPYRAVGTDLETGDAVAMDQGDLVNAVRASMAVPGAFSPVSYGERSLIDGGVAMNLPVEVAQKWGARRIIAVDIAATLKTRDQLLDPFSITDQMITALMQKESRRQRDRLGPRDVLIVPELVDLGSADFAGGMDKGVALGEVATVAALPQLASMRVSEADYAAWRTARVAKLKPVGTIDRVELVNTSGVDDEAILARMSAKPGDAVDPKKIERDLSRLYGLGEFSRVYYTVEADDRDDTVLTYVARNRRWEEDGSIKLGLLLQDDFEGQGEYQLGARYGKRELNRFGGELLLEARTGVGATFGDWGEASLAPFVRRNHFDLRRDSVSAAIPRTTTSAGVDLNFVVDTQDDAEFPSKGWYVQARHTRYLSILDADSHGFTSRLNAGVAFTGLGGRWQLGMRTQDRRGNAFEDVATLGGPFRLSGYGIDTLRGKGAALGTLQFNYPLAQVMQYPLFVGGSLEAGQLWGRGQEPSLERTIFGGSVYTALDTPLGPIYFGLGLAEGGEEAVFFRLGQPD
jgi:NTE family protein